MDKPQHRQLAWFWKLRICLEQQRFSARDPEQPVDRLLYPIFNGHSWRAHRGAHQQGLPRPRDRARVADFTFLRDARRERRFVDQHDP